MIIAVYTSLSTIACVCRVNTSWWLKSSLIYISKILTDHLGDITIYHTELQHEFDNLKAIWSLIKDGINLLLVKSLRNFGAFRMELQFHLRVLICFWHSSFAYSTASETYFMIGRLRLQIRVCSPTNIFCFAWERQWVMFQSKSELLSMALW